MTRLRLIADDLTGTLDTAAGFTGLCGPIPVVWAEAYADEAAGCLAIDTGTRERDAAAADGIVARAARFLDGADIAFKKVDSLLRGPWAAELAAVIRTGAWRRCVVAPAFPYQGRRTEGGQQWMLGEDGWRAVSADIAGTLCEAGLPARRAVIADGPVDGVAVYDAADDDDLARIARFDGDGPVLWCGSRGLAAVLARGSPPPGDARLVGPVLGLFGSDRAETEAQLAACAGHRLVLDPGTPDHARRVAERLARDHVVMVSLRLPKGTAREAAADRISGAFSDLVALAEKPGTLLVAGGETLKALCLALGASRLDVTGEIMPGLPRSILRGGRWDGLPVVSKSGAFGSPTVWRDLLSKSANPTHRNRP